MARREALPPEFDPAHIAYKEPIGPRPPRASDAEIEAAAKEWERRGRPDFAAELRRCILLGI
jgi:hypothetical protein